MDYARSEIQMLNDNGGGVKVMVMEVPGGEFHIIPDEYNSEKEDDGDGMIGEGLVEENPMEDGPIQGELVEDGQVSLDGPVSFFSNFLGSYPSFSAVSQLIRKHSRAASSNFAIL